MNSSIVRFILFILLSLVILAMVVAIVATVIFEAYNAKLNRKNFFLNNIRIYSYSYSKHLFNCFDKMKLSNHKTYNDNEFLSQFKEIDRQLVYEFITEPLRSTDYKKNLQVEIKIKNQEDKYFTSILNITDYDLEKQILHFTSSFPSIDNANKFFFLNFSKNHLLSHNDLASFMKNDAPNHNGAVINIKVAYDSIVDLNDVNEKKKLISINKEIISSLLPYLNEHRKIYLIDNFSQLIVDTLSLSENASMSLALDIYTTISSYLAYNQEEIEHKIKIAIGVATGTYYQKDYKKAISITNEMIDFILSSDNSENILFYDPSLKNKIESINQLKNDVLLINTYKTFRIYYTPVINYKSEKTEFYLSDIDLFSTKTKSFFDYLLMAKDKTVEKTFNLIFSQFENKVIDNECMFSLKIPLKKVVPFIKARKNHPNLKLLLILEDKHVESDEISLNSIYNYFNLLKKNNIKIGIELNEYVFTIESRTILLVDYFFISPKLLKVNDKQNSSLRSLQQKLSHFNTPIVYTGLKSLEDIELGAHYFGELFASDYLSSQSSHLEKIDEDILKEVCKDCADLSPKIILSEN